MASKVLITELDVAKLVDMLAAAQVRERVLVTALTQYAQKCKWSDMDNGDGDLTKRWFEADEDGFLVAQRALYAIGDAG